MNIFFYGGTFDPPHIGHKMIVEYLLPICDKLILIPAKKSPLKKNPPIASGIERIDMLKLLFNDPKIEVDDFEIRSKDKNYTYLTVDYLMKKYKHCIFTMVIGKDQLNSLEKWKFIDTFFNSIKILCFNRNGFKGAISSNFNRSSIKYVDDFNFDVSSTKIRKSINSLNGDLKSMLDLKVLEYIKKNNTYV